MKTRTHKLVDVDFLAYFLAIRQQEKAHWTELKLLRERLDRARAAQCQ